MEIQFRTRAAVLIAAVSCCVSFASSGQQVKPPAPPSPAPPPRSPPVPGRFGGEGLLTEEQRAQLREAMQENRPKLQELDQKLREARRELNEAIFAEKYDEATARQKAMAVAQLDTERVLLRAKALEKVRPTLTAAQLERLKQMPLDFALGQGFRLGPPDGPVPPGIGGLEPGGRSFRRDSSSPDSPRPPRPPGGPDQPRDTAPAK